jgi:hypothetical protein
MKTKYSLMLNVVAAIFISIFLNACGNKIEDQLKEAANELNKSCPMMVDSETRLDNAMTFSGNEFQYNYTLINITTEDIENEQIVEVLKPLLLNNVATNPDLHFFRENDIIMTYYYKDKNGNFLAKIPITPTDYKSNLKED